MKRTTVDFKKAKLKLENYRKSLIYMLSEVKINSSKSDLDDMDWDQVIEARFFDECSELKLIRTDNDFSCVLTEDEASNGAVWLDKSYKASAKGVKKVSVREYADFDEDGQIMTVATRLLDIE